MHKGISVFIAIGANLPGPDGSTPLDTCRQAVVCLDLLPGLRLCSLSNWYLRDPVPASGQPAYVNAVACLIETGGLVPDPAVLLAHLMDIETKFGRRRTAVNEARSLDLDIIGIGDMIRAAPDPILPHPRAHERAFVLVPLIDVAPDWFHPVLGQTAAALLTKVGRQGLVLLHPT